MSISLLYSPFTYFSLSLSLSHATSICLPIYLSLSYLSLPPTHFSTSDHFDIFMTLIEKWSKQIKFFNTSEWAVGNKPFGLSCCLCQGQMEDAAVSRIPSCCLSRCPQYNFFEESCRPPDSLLSVLSSIVPYLPYQQFVRNSSTYIYWSHWEFQIVSFTSKASLPI